MRSPDNESEHNYYIIALCGAEEADFAVYSARGESVISGRYAKEDLAEALVDIIEKEKSS